MAGLSLYDLAFDYIVLFCDDPISISIEEKKTVTKRLIDLLSNGWTSGEIQFNMEFFKDKYPGVPLSLDTYFNNRKPKRVNILTLGQYYYHNELRCSPPPPQVTVNYNTGEITREVCEYFLEMRCSYTLEQLYNYYLQHENLYSKLELHQGKYIGGLKWLIDKYSLELVLYMINIASDMLTANDIQCLSSPMDLQHYLKFAVDALNQRVTEVKAMGDNKIVPKRRVLPSRNRLLDQHTK